MLSFKKSLANACEQKKTVFSQRRYSYNYYIPTNKFLYSLLKITDSCSSSLTEKIVNERFQAEIIKNMSCYNDKICLTNNGDTSWKQTFSKALPTELIEQNVKKNKKLKNGSKANMVTGSKVGNILSKRHLRNEKKR